MKCYSTDEECFNDNEIDDVIEEFIANSDCPAGGIFTVYEGDATLWKASDFLPTNLVETLAENTYEEAGEYAAGWPPYTPEQAADLQQRIEDVVDQWADDYGLQPKFFRVENVRQITVKLLNEQGEYEIDG